MPPEKIGQRLTLLGEATAEETTELEKTAEQTIEQKDKQNSDKNVNLPMKEIKRWHRTNTIRKNNFWTKVLNFARANSIPIEALATLLKEQQAQKGNGIKGEHVVITFDAF